jgi:hypothetical protein
VCGFYYDNILYLTLFTQFRLAGFTDHRSPPSLNNATSLRYHISSPPLIYTALFLTISFRHNLSSLLHYLFITTLSSYHLSNLSSLFTITISNYHLLTPTLIPSLPFPPIPHLYLTAARVRARGRPRQAAATVRITVTPPYTQQTH